MDNNTYECHNSIQVSISTSEDNVITLTFSENLYQTLTLDDLVLNLYTKDAKKIEVSYTLK